jgi:molybdopterin molybdotransferase
MITVEEAFERIVGQAAPLTTEKCPIALASGKVLAAPLAARRSQPSANLSAMDGYAVRSVDLSGNLTKFNVIGESSAGTLCSKLVNEDEAIRIFTGAVVPEGADQVVVQEDCTRDADIMTTRMTAEPQRHIRAAASDFGDRQIVLEAGTFMTPKSIGLAASAGYDTLMVHRAPKVALLSTGDELAAPGQQTFAPHETVNSAAPQLQALLLDAGAKVTVYDQVPDDMASLKKAIRQAANADILVTIGGASVGDKDLMQEALGAEGMTLDFWKIAMRPGKPLIHGTMGKTRVLGLPGNPVSAFVCALLFVRPLIDKLMGRPAPMPTGVPLPLAAALPENGPRQHYMRARLVGEPGKRRLDPAVAQDSSLLAVLAQSDGLIIRPPGAPAVQAGTAVPFMPF